MTQSIFLLGSQQWHRWSQRGLAIRSQALAARPLNGLEQRLQKAEKALAKLALKPGQDAQALEALPTLRLMTLVQDVK